MHVYKAMSCCIGTSVPLLQWSSKSFCFHEYIFTYGEFESFKTTDEALAVLQVQSATWTNLKSNIPLRSIFEYGISLFSLQENTSGFSITQIGSTADRLFQEEILRSFLLSIANQPIGVSEKGRIQGVLYNYGNEHHPALYANESPIARIIWWIQAITSFLSFNMTIPQLYFVSCPFSKQLL